MSDMLSLELGDIKIEPHLPEVFKDESVRALAKDSLDNFKGRHSGELPLKFRIEEFCFQRPEQVCTVDSARKYIAWDGSNTDLTRTILGGLKPDDTSLVLRSHPMTFGIESPTIHTGYQGIQAYLHHLDNPDTPSEVGERFFDHLDLESTVIQLLKNPYGQTGIFLCRPTFVYDEKLRDEILSYRAQELQYREGDYFSVDDAPDGFVGFRVKPLMKEAREKKKSMGTIAIYNPVTKRLELRDGLPVESEQWYKYGRYVREAGNVLGRTVDIQGTGITTIHYDNPNKNHYSYDEAPWLTEPDLEFVQQVLQWQLPRIFAFEGEVRQQDWIPQGLSNTHQFVIFPPQELGTHKVNTQYYDFRPHQSYEEMERLAAEKGKKFASMPTADKIQMFY